jgi:predicted RNase H-like HicB family nuclease
MGQKKSYKVTFERDEDGWWVATATDLAGCHTQGRSIAQARERLREAMALCDVPASAVLDEEIHVGG